MNDMTFFTTLSAGRRAVRDRARGVLPSHGDGQERSARRWIPSPASQKPRGRSRDCSSSAWR